MSETSARARRFALAFGSLARNGLIGGRAGGPSDGAGALDRSGAATTDDDARAGGAVGDAGADVGAVRGAPLETLNGGETTDEGDAGGAAMPLRAPVDAGDGAEGWRGAKGAAGPPIGRAAAGGVERAPALPEVAKGATLDVRGDLSPAAGPLEPALIGGRMNGGATGRGAAPPPPAGAAVATGAEGRTAGATAGAEGAAVAAFPDVGDAAAEVGAVARVTGTAVADRSLAPAAVASDAIAPASVDVGARSGRSRKADAASLISGGGADDTTDGTRAAVSAP